LHRALPNHRPPCATRTISPDTLPTALLDQLLAAGWYRIAQVMMTCEFVSLDHGVEGVLWTRVPLTSWHPSRSARRVLRGVEERLHVTIGPCQHDAEHEAVYRRYIKHVGGDRSPTLDSFRFGHRMGVDLFDTWEITLRDADGALAGFSWFDRGLESVQSLLGAYDPAFASHSIGLYTLLREVAWAKEHGYQYFYAGYVLGQGATMDYKLRSGHIEWLDRRVNQWLPWPDDTPRFDPLTQAHVRLEGVLAMVRHDPDIVKRDYAPFSVGAAGEHLAACLAYPVILTRDAPPGVLVMGWDPVAQHYELLRCAVGALNSADGAQVLIDELFIVVRSLGTFTDPYDAAIALQYA
jgi:arginyl-tRNA--protein-N-Asp/Glu arginylyltransferase